MNAARMNTCRICETTFPTKPAKPDGTLCFDPECRKEARRRQARLRTALASGKQSSAALLVTSLGYCACGARATRCISCEECFQEMTWRACQLILSAAEALSGRWQKVGAR